MRLSRARIRGTRKLAADSNPVHSSTWRALQQLVYCNRRIRDVEQLKEVVQTCWEQIGQDVIDRAMDSFANDYRRRHCRCDRRTHSDAERTCRAVGPTQLTPSHQTRQGCRACLSTAAAAATQAMQAATPSRPNAATSKTLQTLPDDLETQLTPPDTTQRGD